MNGRFSTAEGKLCRVLMRTSPGKRSGHGIRQPNALAHLTIDRYMATYGVAVTWQPMVSLLPCATTFAATAVSVVTSSNDHGNVAPSTRCG